MSDISVSDSAPRISGSTIKWVFCGVIFLSACLLFFIQPLFTRMVLPTIGGAPAVWTTAMLFFQTVLLGGYIYAHLMVKYVPAKAQIWVHLTLWGLALLFLPLGMPEGWQPDPAGSAVGQTLMLYALGVGVPFAFLSANAPLIQSWYRRSGGPSADDPYFLYGASNLGSMGALIGFTLLAEPLLGVAAQAGFWSLGFGVLGLGFGGLALVLVRAKDAGLTAQSDAVTANTRAKIGLDQMSRWLILAFVPSSLMLAVTTKISTDLGNLPLFWVLPLVIYLLTFVATFTHRPWVSDTILRLSILPAIGLGLYCYHQLTLAPLLALVPIFALITLYAHRRLYQARPSAENLTLFYVIMSVGGAAGGLFNSVVAPLAFDSLFEGTATFLLAVAMLFFVSPTPGVVPATWRRYVALGGAVLAIAAVMTELVWLDVAVLAGVLFAALMFLPRPASLIMSVVAVTGLGTLWQHPDALFQDRSFFGTHKVLDLP
ncbi:MAG: transporter, partial [Pseudomonadota bacterium]